MDYKNKLMNHFLYYNNHPNFDKCSYQNPFLITLEDSVILDIFANFDIYLKSLMDTNLRDTLKMKNLNDKLANNHYIL